MLTGDKGIRERAAALSSPPTPGMSRLMEVVERNFEVDGISD
jgi:hypothetical protein